jgi:hypothetical protein
MHALSGVSRTINDPLYLRWALKLAQTAHQGFTYTTSEGARRMYWKMSIDLSHPHVQFMGQQDPLDGYITYNELQAATRNFRNSPDLLNINPEIQDMAQICRGMSWVTDDPLGIGGLLSDSLKIAQLKIKSPTSDEMTDTKYEKLLQNMLESALIGLKSYSQRNPQNFPAEYRLAFREMGLSIGIKGVEYLYNILESNKNQFEQYNIHQHIIKALLDYMPLAFSLESFWLKDENRKSNTWTEHREINMVMLATSLAPGGFLRI